MLQQRLVQLLSNLIRLFETAMRQGGFGREWKMGLTRGFGLRIGRR